MVCWEANSGMWVRPWRVSERQRRMVIVSGVGLLGFGFGYGGGIGLGTLFWEGIEEWGRVRVREGMGRGKDVPRGGSSECMPRSMPSKRPMLRASRPKRKTSLPKM